MSNAPERQALRERIHAYLEAYPSGAIANESGMLLATSLQILDELDVTAKRLEAATALCADVYARMARIRATVISETSGAGVAVTVGCRCRQRGHACVFEEGRPDCRCDCWMYDAAMYDAARR